MKDDHVNSSSHCLLVHKAENHTLSSPFVSSLTSYFLHFHHLINLINLIKMVAISKSILAAIAVSAVQAHPQPTLTTVATPSPANATASVAPTPDPEVQKALFLDLFTAPTAIKRFQRLLTAKGQSLLSGDALRSLIVFDFNGAKPAKGALGGATKAAVRLQPFKHHSSRLLTHTRTSRAFPS